ncbi:MAG: serpin family protein [Bacteroides sp.]|nr:serpin family protein [Bacteroides sp.]
MTLLAGTLTLGGIFASGICAESSVRHSLSVAVSYVGENEDVSDTEAATPQRNLRLTHEQIEVSNALRRFASNLLLECVKTEEGQENIFISPLGIANMLAMLANGGNEKTVKEITDLLGADLEQLTYFYPRILAWLPYI